jgi:hypothetical protein
MGHINYSILVRLNLIHILQNISPLVIPHRIKVLHYIKPHHKDGVYIKGLVMETYYISHLDYPLSKWGTV